MSYNTECLPCNVVVPDDEQPCFAELGMKAKVVFACGREVPYDYAYRFRPAENRRPCKRCSEKANTTSTWARIEERFRELKDEAFNHSK